MSEDGWKILATVILLFLVLFIEILIAKSDIDPWIKFLLLK